MSSASSFCFERLLLAGALCGAVCSWPNEALAQTASEGLASAGAGAPAPLDALDCSRRPLDCRDSSLLQRGLAERLLGHSTAIAPNRPTSMDAIAHEQGTVVLLTYEHESQLVFLDPQNEARWQRRLPADRVRTSLLRGASSDRVCRAIRRSEQTAVGSMPARPLIEVQCFRGADGESLPSVYVTQSGSSTEVDPLLGSVGDDGALALYSETRAFAFAVPDLQQIRVLGDGRELRRSFASAKAIISEGGEAIVVNSTGGRFRFDAGGRLMSDGWPAPVTTPLAMGTRGDFLGLVRLDPREGPAQRALLAWTAADRPGIWSHWVLAPRLYNNALSGANGTQVLDLPLRPSVSAAGGSDGGPWAFVANADSLTVLDHESDPPGRELRIPRRALRTPTIEGWAMLPAFRGDGVLLLRMDPQGLELRRLRPGSGRISAPVHVPTVLDSDVSSSGLAFGSDRLVLAPLTPGGPLRVARAPDFASDQPVTNVHSGLWFDPQTSGQGLMLDVSVEAGRWFAGWFAFTHRRIPNSERGAHRLAWYTALGRAIEADSALPIEGRVFETLGRDFEGLAPTRTQVLGNIALRAIDCNTLEFSYRLQAPIGSVPQDADFAYVGARLLQRLGPAPAACGGTSLSEQSGLRSASSGSWVLEGRPSQGVLMQVDPGAAGAAAAVWGAWFGFDAVGPHWLTLSGRSVAGQPGMVDLEWRRTLGGDFDSVPTQNTRRVGSGRLRFLSCDRAVLEYRFDTLDLPRDGIAGQQGQVNLRRSDPCP